MAASTARLTVDPALIVSPVRPRTFGSFVEHRGRCVYTGIHDPAHPTADADGFRQDVIDLVREMGVTAVRYPGGNFVSGYRWEDGVGPKDQRPARLDLAWHSLETNQVGTDEFMRWAAKAGVEPMMAVNLGTRGVLEAVDILDYCNGTAPTALAEQRRNNGGEQPYGVRMWCLGNEMDGPWQTGHKTAHEYGRIAAEAGRAMRQVDPNLELVACGSSGPNMDTFGEWERVVLTECYDQVDYISIHRYYEETDGDLASFLGSAVDMDAFIDDVVATADGVRAALKKEKRIQLSFDEWNVWYQSRAESIVPSGDDWPVAPTLLEDKYTAADAVVVANLLISLLRHSDRVHAACQAQLVNVIAPIMTEPGGPAWKQTIFHPFAKTAALAKGDVLRLHIDAPTYETAKYGAAPLVDAVATHDPATGDVTIFAVNRDVANPVEFTVDLSAFESGFTVAESWILADDDVYAYNSKEAPERVELRPFDGVVIDGGAVTVTLPKVSWSAIRFTR